MTLWRRKSGRNGANFYWGKMDILFLDFETRSQIDLKKVGSYVYATHPSTEVLATGFAFNDSPVTVNRFREPPPARVVDHVRSGGKVVAHNAFFELLIWNFCWSRYFTELPPLKISQTDCTMVMSYTLGLPGKLEQAAPAAGITEEKDMKGHRVMLQLSQPKEIYPDGTIEFYSPETHPEKFDRLYSYCAKDVEVEKLLYPRLLPLSRSEREIWEIDYHINLRGVRVDLSSAHEALFVVDHESERFDADMKRITGGAVATVNANAQLKSWLLSQGVPVDGVAKAEVIDALNDTELPEIARQALLIRQEAAKSSTKKISALIQRTSSEDERLRFSLQYYGAGTGRWAGRGFQLHNLPRPTLKQHEIEGVFSFLKGG
jgi:DNA polymerase